jgi:hypothetical protein
MKEEKEMGKKIVTRRDFLKVAAMTPFAGAWACSVKSAEKKESTGKLDKAGKVKVILIRDEDALLSFKKPNPDVIQRMLDEAVATLFGESTAVSAWKRIIKASDIVGIKSNVWRPIPTTREVEQAIKRRIMDAGVPEKNIGVDDRGVRRNPIFQNATAFINARPARTHHWSGMGGCIKNPIMFVPRASDYHGDSCADLATLWTEFNLKERTKLNILLMLNPLFHGIGPHHYSDKYVWEYKGILVSQDPVAVDSIGVQILQAKRREFFGEDRPLQPPAKHIYLADTRHNLGVSRPEKIQLIKLGWQEGILI